MAAKAIELLHSSGPYIAVHLRYEIDWIVHKGNEMLPCMRDLTHHWILRLSELRRVNRM